MKKLFGILIPLVVIVGISNVLHARITPEVGLTVGTPAPDFKAKNYKGEDIQFSDYFQNGPVVLIFYRGGWCYFCNIQLKEYQSRLSDFQEFGVKIVAVSVDKIEKSADTVSEKKLGFEVISDPSANLLESYNVVYQVPEELAQEYLSKYKIDLEEASGRTDRIIAIPATYVVDTTGKIIFAYANEDYKVRKSAQDIINFLKEQNF